MNYLAHLHLADTSDSHALGNLLGDFVKGPDLSAYPLPVSRGIRLHRAIDQYTDRHDVNSEARALFPDRYRRYAGISLDVFWDYFLSRHWQQFHALPREEWIAQQYATMAKQHRMLAQTGTRLDQILPRMIEHDWLNAYAEADNIRLALSRIGQRLRRPVALEDTLVVLEQEEARLEQLFLRFYPQVMDFALWTAQSGPH